MLLLCTAQTRQFMTVTTVLTARFGGITLRYQDRMRLLNSDRRSNLNDSIWSLPCQQTSLSHHALHVFMTAIFPISL